MATTSVVKNNRINKAEVEVMKNRLDPERMEQTGGEVFEDLCERVFTQVGGYKQILNGMTIESLLTYSRYQTANENRFYKAIFALRSIKSSRSN